MSYVLPVPADPSDPLLREWSEPIAIVEDRVDGVQPHGPQTTRGSDPQTHDAG